MKVKLVYEPNDDGTIVEMKMLVRVGEQLKRGADQTFEVVQVVHTPTSRKHAAIAVLRNVDPENPLAP